MKCFILFVILGVLCVRNEAVTCECSYAQCPTVDNAHCKRGVAQDICGCCTICAGDVGEHCGGPWGLFGKCGEGLDCQQSSCPENVVEVECYMYYLTEPGTCVEKRHHSIVDMLQGTHLNELNDSSHNRRLRLLKELESAMRK